jgi:thioredoxin-related protein
MFRIESYPFILFFKDTSIYRYTGGLETEALLKYLSGDNYKDTKLASVYSQDM